MSFSRVCGVCKQSYIYMNLYQSLWCLHAIIHVHVPLPESMVSACSQICICTFTRVRGVCMQSYMFLYLYQSSWCLHAIIHVKVHLPESVVSLFTFILLERQQQQMKRGTSVTRRINTDPPTAIRINCQVFQKV